MSFRNHLKPSPDVAPSADFHLTQWGTTWLTNTSPRMMKWDTSSHERTAFATSLANSGGLTDEEKLPQVSEYSQA
nr:hypothetical protein HmN_000903800 [Hymenolepis microstoma]CUU97806.1 hypothetical transcript [Hymenolepis microstoma]